MQVEKNSILIISEGAPPVGDNLVEGGGLRAWGLATGLSQNATNITLAFNENYEIGETDKKINSIHIITWNSSNISLIVKKYKTIILSYAMGYAPNIVNLLSSKQILVLDCYVPIAVEVSARNTRDHKNEFNQYTKHINAWKDVLRRGDYFLYASESQRKYYIGYLSAINRLNPLTYEYIGDRLIYLPYGVNSKDSAPVNKNAKNTLLWYGGFYPWFNIEKLVDGVELIKKSIPDLQFIVAGAKNPYNKNPDFKNHYEKSMRSIKRLGDTVKIIDWTSYKERLKIYSMASAIITLNHKGLENSFAWRTRLVDYLVAKKIILTNAGDPLGDELVEKGIALKFNCDDNKDISEKFMKALSAKVDENKYDELIKKYDWVNLTAGLNKELIEPTRLEQPYFESKSSLRQKLKDTLIGLTVIYNNLKKRGVKDTYQKIKLRVMG